MRKISLFTASESTVTSLIHQALNEGFIHSGRMQELNQEIEDFTLELVLYFNHNQSTSIHKNYFLRVLDTINYVFLHGVNTGIYSYQSLNDVGIKTIFYFGLKQIKNDVKKISELLREAQKNLLQTKNDRYLSIIYEQIPSFLQSLVEYHSLFNYCYVEPNLDYPLFDGLPLYHDMYKLQGTDLVLYYVERFIMENTFCYKFSNAFPLLIDSFEKLKGVSIQFLGINLCELVFYQVLANLMINERFDVILTVTDVDRLNAKLIRSSNVNNEVTLALERIGLYTSIEAYNYFLSFKSDIIRKIKLFLSNEYELFIYPPSDFDKYTIVNNPTSSQAVFLKLLNELKKNTPIEEKLICMKNLQISIYDLFDLLDNDVFVGEEYLLYFDSLSIEEISIIIKMRNPDINVFNQLITLDDSLLLELNITSVWEEYFILFLRNICKEKKQEIESFINKLRLM